MVTHWQLDSFRCWIVRSNRISSLAVRTRLAGGTPSDFQFIPFHCQPATNYRSLVEMAGTCFLAFSLLVLLATSRAEELVTIAAAGLTTLFLGRDMLRAIWNWFVGGFTRARFGCGDSCAILLPLLALSRVRSFFSDKKYFSRLRNINADSLNEYGLWISMRARAARIR
ncbi:hypothetical protein [Candidatus Villigracilis saccharophilus]|uniref:hypothetical protein n=1 Tax=Candidatus Villigracilis saccharophilus TaxID=3140684 RepID=UPI003135192B|nr:hypothetical protein [Anaerolineales bacterium]